MRERVEERLTTLRNQYERLQKLQRDSYAEAQQVVERYNAHLARIGHDLTECAGAIAVLEDLLAPAETET